MRDTMERVQIKLFFKKIIKFEEIVKQWFDANAILIYKKGDRRKFLN